MSCNFPLRNLLAPAAAVLLSLLPEHLSAQTVSQDLTLLPGWNAVWLEVAPVDSDGLPQSPEDIFGAHQNITIVLSPKLLAGTAEFFADDPSEVTTVFNQPEWEQWTQPAQAADNLTQITGNRAYLIKTLALTTVTIEGNVEFHPPVWAPDRYNLIGFGLDSSPTFDSFFAASGTTHPTNRIYRLIPDTGKWVVVADPATETMTSNEAYWVFASGPSNYMGPVAVDFDSSAIGILSFGGPDDVVTVGSGASALYLDLEEITFTNLNSSGNAATPTLDLINSDDDSGNFSLRTVTPVPSTLGYTAGNLVDTAPGASPSPSSLDETVAPLSSAILTLGAIREWESGSVSRTNVYRLGTGAGSAFWLPVTALLSSVELATDTLGEDDAAVAGLWVGEVSVTSATSLVEDGSPVREAATPAPLRILLHSDSTGKVNLLSQVTLMQTKTADSSIPSDPVLVVDSDQIPIFEGIRERNDKRVGLRIETVAFDMPRSTTEAAQSDGDDTDGEDDLIDTMVSEATSTGSTWSDASDYDTRAKVLADIENAIDSFLIFSSGRPSTLQEAYDLTLLCDGALGAGKTVQTITGTLSLDGFHRSNPFRHAYSQKHTKGPSITRELSIVFDPEQSVSDRLLGTYEEGITGLTKSTITLTGTIKLERISTVDTLQGAP